MSINNEHLEAQSRFQATITNTHITYTKAPKNVIGPLPFSIENTGTNYRTPKIDSQDVIQWIWQLKSAIPNSRTSNITPLIPNYTFDVQALALQV